MATPQLALELRGVRVRLAGRLLDRDGPAQCRDFRRHAEVPALVVGVLERRRRLVMFVADGRDQRVRRHGARLGDERLLVGVAVRDQLASRRDDHRVAMLADADAVDHAPHLLERELASQPAGALVQAREADDERRRRQEIFVDADRRHVHALDDRRRVLGDDDPRLAGAARHDRRAGFVKQRDLAELAELEDVVLEDLILLPALETGILQVGRQRFQQRRVADDVATDFFGRSRGDVDVAGDDGVVRAALEREQGDGAVGQQRNDRRHADEQRESGSDVPNPKLHPSNCGWLVGYRQRASKAVVYPGYRAQVPTGLRNAC